MIGTRLGIFEITAKLGEGGMGVVYRAKDLQLGEMSLSRSIQSLILESSAMED